MNKKDINMENVKDIKAHLMNEGYTDVALNKILGFAIGMGLKAEDEKWLVQHGENSWEHFWEWYTKDEEPVADDEEEYELTDEEEEILLSLIEDICLLGAKSENVSKMQRHVKQLDFIIDMFGLVDLDLEITDDGE